MNGSPGNHTPRERLAIVICTYNRSASLTKTLESLYADGYDGSVLVDILVVANNCSDDTLHRLETFRATHPHDALRVDWIEEPTPGKSHALNAAIRRTDHDVLCFIDDDQVVERGFIASVLQGIAKFTQDEIFCGRIWPAWDGSEPKWVHAPEPYAIPIRPFPEYDLGAESIEVTPSGRLPSGGNIAVRRRVFARTGEFSVELGPKGHNLAGGEDHDFLLRAVESGARVRYLPGMRQLHAIDPVRTSTTYTLKKSYLRSRDNFIVHPPVSGVRLYMARKIASHCLSVLLSVDSNRRFFYLARLAASLGELRGALGVALDPNALQAKSGLPLLPKSRLIGAMGIMSVLLGTYALVAGGAPAWRAAEPTMAVAAISSLLLLVKSLLDFSQTGPRIREEVLAHYRPYGLYALARLAAWSFVLMLFTGGGGAILYCALALGAQWEWSPLWAAVCSGLGILLATGLQFVAKLRFNPGLLVASMHYRTSRLYSLWNCATPSRIRQLRITCALAAAALLLAASARLLAHGQVHALQCLWAIAAGYVLAIAWASWQPEPGMPRRPAARGETRGPNILMIGADTLRADRLGAAGYARNLTPNMDALAQQGTLFTNCYVPCARTAPSLISMLTGTWPHTHGIRDNFVTDEESRLKLPTLPKLLGKLGYRSAALSDWCGADLGKFSLGFDLTDLPADQWNIKYLLRQGPKDLRLFLSLFTHNRLGRTFLPEIYYLGGAPLTSRMGTRARELLSRLGASDEPFFLNLFFSTTHPPFASEWPWYNQFSDPDYQGESKFAMAKLTDPFEIIRRQGMPKEEFDLNHIIDLYDGCVAQFDAEVGHLLEHLKATGLAENTIVVLYSDHGMEFFEHETWGQGNSAVGEASPRIPLLIHDPRKGGRGVVTNVVRSIDVAPTLLDLVGVPVPAQLDGVSLASFLGGGADCPEVDAFNETGIWIGDIPGLPEAHLRYPDLMELLEVPDRATGTLAIKRQYREIIVRAKDRMMRSGRWKLVYQPLTDGKLLRLFDLETDPDCRHDLSRQQPELASRLWRRLAEWIREDTMSRLDLYGALPFVPEQTTSC